MDRFDLAGQAFAGLCRTMATLRGPQGCPWDRDQTLESLKAYLLEEAYETLEAMDGGPPQRHCEELGDLLLQIVFQAEIASETGDFDAATVARGIDDKLVRRHPHVFSDAPADDAAGATRHWEAQKAAERPAGESILDGIPKTLPALLRALKTGEKAAAIGFDWPQVRGAMSKVEEEWRELQEVSPGDDAHLREELGDLLFAVVNVARHLRIDPESALTAATEKFQRRFRQVEDAIAEQDVDPQSISLDQLEALWETAKSREGTAP